MYTQDNTIQLDLCIKTDNGFSATATSEPCLFGLINDILPTAAIHNTD